MANNHILTKNIGNLRGFSTDSIFVRPSNIADKAINVMRYPDGTLSARRGYQCQIGDIGGLGTGTYHSAATDSVETVTINDDGQLYKKLNKQIYLYYDGRVTGTITGATQANPCQITSVGHNLQTGAQIIIRNVQGMIQLNNQTFTITVTGANTFTLNGIDSTAYGAYVAGGEWSIAFADNRYLTFTIFTDPRYLNTNPGWSLAPWSLAPWGAPAGESITCQILVNRAGIINGNQNNVNTITLQFGHEFAIGDVVVFNNSVGVAQQRNVTGTTATSITVDGLPVSVLNGVYVNQFFDIPFRKGYDVVTPYTIQTFIDTITNALTGVKGLQVAANGDTDYAAAFIQIIEPTLINSDTVFTLQYYYWEQVNKTVAVTFPGSANVAYQNSDEFENASFATFDDVIYIANGIDYPHKYDDQTVYLAGMPVGVRPNAVSAGAGQLSDGTYTYGITYEQVDNIGRTVEGAISERFQLVLSGGPSNATVTVNNIQAGSGYNTNCALATGGLATAYGPDDNGYYYDRIAVSAGHTMKVGDTAYYKDTIIATKNGASAGNETTFTVFAGHGVEVGDTVTFLNTANETQVRIVTAVSTTTITVQGQAVQVANNATFAANKANLVYGNVAIVNGTQGQVNTINVNVGYTLVAGDQVSFTDSEGRVQRRNVTGVGAGTITIDGIPVDVTNGALISCTSIPATAIAVRRSNATAPTLAAGAPISNNLRINLWRTAQDGSQLQLLTTLPNNSFAATQTFTDSVKAGRKAGSITGATAANPCVITSDAHGLQTGNQITITGVQGMVQLNQRNYTITVLTANTFSLNGVNSTAYTAYSAGGSWSLIFSENSQLGVNFPDPIRLPNPPPVCKYLLSFGNQLLYAGGKQGEVENDDNVFFSEGNQPEAVPAATNFFTVPSPDDQITGIGASGTTLIVTKNYSIYAVTGDLLTSQFQVTPIAPGTNIGCVAHATIQSVGSLLYFLHTNGVYAITENQLYPTDPFGNAIAISTAIDVLFRQTNFLPQTRYVFKRAVAVNYTKDNQYLLFLPCEDSQTTQRVANANSILLCYDYQGKNWFKWTNINAAGGMFAVGDDLYFHERRFSGVVGNTANLYKQHRFYRLVDHADHTGPQRIDWASSWEDLGLPEVRKKFVRCMLLIDRITDLQQFNTPEMSFYTCLDRIENLKNTIAPITTVNNNNNAGWSNAPWGWNIWAGYQDSFARINLKGGTVAKSIQVGFTLTGINMDFRLSGVQLEAVPENRKTFVR